MTKSSMFKKSKLVHSIQSVLRINALNPLICTSLLLGSVSLSYAQQSQLAIQPHPTQLQDSQQESSSEQTASTPVTLEDAQSKSTQAQTTEQHSPQLKTQTEIDSAIQDALNSEQMLREQLRALEQQNDEQMTWAQLEALAPINEEDLKQLEPLSDLTVTDREMNEIATEAALAEQDAAEFLANEAKAIPQQVQQLPELPQINREDLNTNVPYVVSDLIQKIANDQNEVSESAATQINTPRLPPQQVQLNEMGFFKRLYYRVRPSKLPFAKIQTRINVQVSGGSDKLNANVKARLSNFTIESFREFDTARPQLRTWATQAAQAVGYYNAEFGFTKVDEQTLAVQITPNEPVIMAEPNIDIRGEGANLPVFQIIQVVPDQEAGDIFHHGEYETTKQRISDAGRENGFFDAYWRLHDVKILQPQNIAEVDLRYETGDRYELGPVTFKMRDAEKPLPIRESVLQKMVPWNAPQNYESWRVDLLSENLVNSRYFNYAAVTATVPDPVPRIIELPKDLDQLVKDKKISLEELQQALGEQFQIDDVTIEQQTPQLTVNDEASLNCLDHSTPDYDAYLAVKLQQNPDYKLTPETQQSLRKNCIRKTKVIPVEVTLIADRLNTLETGVGFGTDTGFRLRSQYRRSIVNSLGHSFEANLEASEIRQAIDGRYSIPYKHPLDDVITVVGGYEREIRDSLGYGIELDIESAVLGLERSIKARLGNWQHTYSARYRFDNLNLVGEGEVNIDDIPPAFLITADSEQESLLFGYEASRTDSDDRINPTKGLKQTYRVEVGSESLLTDTDMAIISAAWRFIYSLDEDTNHQIVGRADLGHIWTDNFNAVPYNLRFFAGGDQSIRGFDYKSLGDRTDGYLIGGQNLAVGSLEYNYQFKDGWRAAIFTDFGNAYDNDFKTKTEYSAGLGIRWKSPVGPIRLDVAAGVSDTNVPIRLHFFIGPQL